MYDDLILPITENDILKEVSKELNIDSNDVQKTFDIWIKYLKHISKETDQCMVDFPELGKMYFSKQRCKIITNKKDKELRDIKLNNLNDFFKDSEYQNIHELTPIVHRWGINRPNYLKFGKDKFTLDELVDKQNSKFNDENNKFNK